MFLSQKMTELGDPEDYPSLNNNGPPNMNVSQLRRLLESLALSPRGHKDRLKKRLKAFLKSSPSDLGLHDSVQKETYFGCLDFEATCHKDSSFDYPNQIIEFPLVLLNSKGDLVDEFHSFVKPTEPLSAFCTELTGISQVTENDSAKRPNFNLICPK